MGIIPKFGIIPFWQIALRLEVWGYKNEVRLRGLPKTRVGGFGLSSRDFQSPGYKNEVRQRGLLKPV